MLCVRGRVGAGQLRRAGETKACDDQRQRGISWCVFRSDRESEFVSGRIVRVANHVRLSLRKIEIDLNGRAVSRLKNPNGRGARSQNRARLGKMAARQYGGLLLRRGHAGRIAEVVLVIESALSQRNVQYR